MFRQCSLALETRENPERSNTLRHSSGNRHIDFAQPKHLQSMDESHIPRRAGRSDRIRRTGNLQIERRFARWIISDRSRIMVVRPILRVVVEFGNIVDFVLRLDIAVFGYPYVNSYAILGHVFEIKTAVLNGLLSAINRDTARPRSHANFLFLLIT